MNLRRKRKMFSILIEISLLMAALLLGCKVTNTVPAVPASLSMTSEGWTAITPGADSRIVYVSSSQGDDSNDGLSPGTPVKTMKKASSLVREGYPDYILLKCGDVWSSSDGRLVNRRFHSGRNSSEPTVISYYGTGERPRIEINKASGPFINTDGAIINHLAIIGLHFYGYQMNPKDPGYDPSVDHNPDGLRFVGGGDDILIEDCKFEFLETVVQGYEGEHHTNIKFRRNIVVDVYCNQSTTSYEVRPSGFYAAKVDGLLIEENTFDHNGWNSSIATAMANMYNHNIYLQDSNNGSHITIRGNIIARGASNGIQSRSGGLIENNLLVNNSCGFNVTKILTGNNSICRNNVVTEGRLMPGPNTNAPRTSAVWGIDFSSSSLQGGTLTLHHNIVAHCGENGSKTGISSVSRQSITYDNNIQYQWGGGIGDMYDPNWLDPERSVGSYHGTLGGTATLEAFLSVVRNRELHTWPLEYTAYAVNDYIREGFNMTAATPLPILTSSSPASSPVPETTHTLHSASAPTSTQEPAFTPVSAPTQEPASSDLAGHWMLDSGSGSTAVDSSGNGNNGTLYNGPVWSAGQAGGALSFDGSDDYVDLGNPSGLQLTGAITLSAWVKIDTTAGNGRIIAKQGGPNKRGWSLNVESSGVGSFQIASNATTSVVVDTEGALPVGQWLHLAGVYEPGEALGIYVNGELDNTNTASIPAEQFNNSRNVNIGRRNDNSCWFDGLIDDVRIYDRALSKSEISDLAGE